MNSRWWILKRRTRTLEKRKVTVKIMVAGTLEELTEKFEEEEIRETCVQHTAPIFAN